MADKKPKYPRFDAAVVNEALSIEDLAGRYGAELVRSPRGFAARCILPGHDDRTPSLQIYTDNNSFHCFGCGRGGDALKFVAIMEGLTEKREFGQVIRLAAQLAGVARDGKDDRGGWVGDDDVLPRCRRSTNRLRCTVRRPRR